jgi:hypothetical protein
MEKLTLVEVAPRWEGDAAACVEHVDPAPGLTPIFQGLL